MDTAVSVKVPFYTRGWAFYIYSAFLGMFGGLGFYCLMNVIAIAALGSQGEHPISAPSYTLLGLFALIVCIILLGIYWTNYSYIKKKLQTLLHFITVLAGFVFGLPFSGLMDRVVRSILEPMIK